MVDRDWVASLEMATKLAPTTRLANGTEIPLLGFGTYKLEEGAEVERAVSDALEIGYRHIDTAAFYENEEGVGRAIRSSGIPREEIFLTTKIWTDDMRRGEEGVMDAFEQSLDRLGLDYVDLYLTHWPAAKHYVKAWRTLEEIYEDGRPGDRGQQLSRAPLGVTLQRRISGAVGKSNRISSAPTPARASGFL